MDVRWLVTSGTVGSKQTVFGVTVFPPGARHDIHRHPNAEEVEYLIEGRGIARVGGDDVLMETGDIVFASVDELHGFRNTSPTDRAVMVWCYGGAPDLETAGYVRDEP
jgi:quercetin dioxygenase-like cupin family protein